MHVKLPTAAFASLLLLVGCDQPSAGDQSAPVEAPAGEAKPEAKTEAKPAEDPHAEFANVTADELAGLIESKKAVPVDANDASIREKYGIVPGAVLLSNATGFEASELPADKGSKLVFYCGNERCTAAPKAAALAKKAGYEDVAVMRVGIRGWVDAGQEVEKPAS